MESLFLAGLIALASGVYTLGRFRRNKHERSLAEVSRVLNLRVAGDGQLWGRVRGHDVSVDVSQDVVVRVELKGLMMSTVGIAQEISAATSLLRFAKDEYELGDCTFDSLAHIQGDERLLAAVFAHDNRQKAGHLLKEYDAVFERSLIRCTIPKHVLSHVRTTKRRRRVDYDNIFVSGILECIEHTLACAQGMSVHDDTLYERIVKNVETDPSNDFRLFCLDVLVRRYPNHDSTHEVIRRCAHAKSARIRLRVAPLLGPDSFPILRQIAMDECADEVTRIDALKQCSQIASPHAMGTLATECLRGGLIPTALGIIDKVGHRPAIGPIIELLDTSDPEDGAFAASEWDKIVSLLCRLGGPEALIGLARLYETGHASLTTHWKKQIGAVFKTAGLNDLNGLVRILKTFHGVADINLMEAIGRVGTLETISELIAAKQRINADTSRDDDKKKDVIDSINRAIQSIHTRHGVIVQAGGLSLAGHDASQGALSLTDPCDPEKKT